MFILFRLMFMMFWLPVRLLMIVISRATSPHHTAVSESPGCRDRPGLPAGPAASPGRRPAPGGHQPSST